MTTIDPTPKLNPGPTKELSSSTPYLLKRVYELTGGRSLVANIALVRNNAAVAAQIAAALSHLRASGA